MSLTDPQPPKKTWRGIWGIVAAVAIFVVASVIATLWLGPDSNDTQVIEQWNATISKLGIDPVFPPEEDVAVGDIYAVLDDRQGQASSGTALALRSIKLDHKDLTKDIELVQRESYHFPDTAPRPDDENKPWEQQPNADGILSHPAKLTTLPLAAFPGFTIRQQRAVHGGLLGWLSTAFGFQSDRGVELNIPVAETYGIPSIIAVGELEQFCSDKDYPNRCSDQTLRRHLAFVTPHAFELNSNYTDVAAEATPASADAVKDTRLQAPSSRRYKYPLEVVLVNRVYLARYIDQRVQDSRSAKTSIGPAKQGNQPAEKPSAPDQKQQAGSVDNGAALVFSKDDGQSVKQTFLRPLVIGYRAVKRIAKEDIVRTTGATSPSKLQSCLDDAKSENPNRDCRAALGSTPPPAINATQPTGSDARPNTDDPKRYRLYLHTAGRPEAFVKLARDALKGGGYAIQGEDADADTDSSATNNGAGVDYFSDADGVGATNVARLVADATKAVVLRRRQIVYNPVGVLGVWLPIASPPPTAAR